MDRTRCEKKPIAGREEPLQHGKRNHTGHHWSERWLEESAQAVKQAERSAGD